MIPEEEVETPQVTCISPITENYPPLFLCYVYICCLLLVVGYKWGFLSFLKAIERRENLEHWKTIHAKLLSMIATYYEDLKNKDDSEGSEKSDLISEEDTIDR